jgi:ribosomal protein L10
MISSLFYVEKMQLKVAGVLEKLEDSSLLFAIPQRGFSMKMMTKLRNSLPPRSTMMVVKNKLMEK